MKNKMTEKLFELAYTDSMTEVQNRNAYEERLKNSESNVLPYISQFKDTIYFINNEKLYNLSVSIGYSRFHEKYSKGIDDIICRADEKMYKDKKSKK